MENLLPNFDAGVPHPTAGGLLPVITQDAATGRVLMLAWMNHAAYQATIAENRAVYYSRSRNELWRKGDTSGHVQRLVELRIDCDADAVLLRVDQTGAACHKGYPSCFYRKRSGQTFEIIDDVLDEP